MWVVVGGSTLAYLGLAWLSNGLLGMGWPILLANVLLAVTLVQRPPDGSVDARRALSFATWTARAVLMAALAMVEVHVVVAEQIAWRLAIFSAIAFMPVLWLPLHQLRQFALLETRGLISASHLVLAAATTIPQAMVIFAAALSWLTGGVALWSRMGATLLAMIFLFGGNFLLGSRIVPQESV